VSRWLLLVHQLPAEPSNLRVKVWRRLRAVGAVPVKNSVYVLPNNDETREDLEWIRGEIVSLGGEAVVFAADAVDTMADEEVVEVLAQAHRVDWEELARLIADLEGRRRKGKVEVATAERELRSLRNRAAQLDRIDFFEAAGRVEVFQALDLAGAPEAVPRPSRPQASTAQPGREEYRARRWLTRPRPGVDRMASAWLIRSFIDPASAFEFAERVPPDGSAVPFDMFGVELGHQGGRCTFETLVAVFGLEAPVLGRIGLLVRRLDLKEEAGSDPEAAMLGRLVEGLREAIGEDGELLERGMLLFEALYRSFRAERG